MIERAISIRKPPMTIATVNSPSTPTTVKETVTSTPMVTASVKRTKYPGAMIRLDAITTPQPPTTMGAAHIVAMAFTTSQKATGLTLSDLPGWARTIRGLWA